MLFTWVPANADCRDAIGRIFNRFDSYGAP
jgi:hypothetical protein